MVSVSNSNPGNDEDVAPSSVTIIPLVDNFRYRGGGDFTGRVFCSTLEGEPPGQAMMEHTIQIFHRKPLKNILNEWTMKTLIIIIAVMIMFCTNCNAQKL